MHIPGSWGPDNRRGAVSITFDNLGEAADLERGLWPKDKPLGQHSSVTHALPHILAMLQELHLPATFFIEGLSLQMYPAAIAEIVKDGHEVALHAWRHEAWQHLDPIQEAQILARSIQTAEQLGIKPYGFRPPGGRLTASSVKLLKQAGLLYCSPEGPRAAISDGLVFLPFAWQCVDAYFYLPRFSDLRSSFGESYDPLPPSSLQTSVRSALEKCIQGHSYLSLIFHPFLEEDLERFEVMRSVLEELRNLVQDEVVWCAPCREVAQWMLAVSQS